jgi:uncharacterized protein (TIGR02421 family)
MNQAHATLRELSDELVALQRPIKILKAINWSPQVHARFFAGGARALPKVAYAPLPFEPNQKVREFLALKRRIRGKNEVEELLRRKCEEFATVVRMLAARGTRRFFEHSVLLYGDPRDRYADPTVDNVEIAKLWASRPPANLDHPTLSAEEARTVIEGIIAPVLGAHCKVRLSARLTANAAAGATRVAVKAKARFSPIQARALAHHEGLWHVLTSINGYRQPVLTLLGVGLPRFTESQEGAGILAEFLTGNLTDDRFIELGERTLAVDMAARGADYVQVYRSLCEKFPPPRAAQMCERVFRGGVLTGGAPFTKDAAYQRGYLRTFQFLRAAISRVDTRLVLAFLAGKMNIDDAPLIKHLIAEGVCEGPRFLPQWWHDFDVTAAQFTHAVTMHRFAVSERNRVYAERAMRGEADGLKPPDAD